MKVSDVCKSYFSGFQEAYNFKENDSKTIALALLKILSYFTVVIPLGFAVVYGTASLCGRVSKKQDLSSQDKSINDQAKKNILKNDSPTSSQVNVSELAEKAKIFVKDRYHSDEILDYIQDVLDNPKFKENAQLFMDNWKEKRGFKNEFRIVEDSALMFFKKELHP